jgi:NAD-dependent oxidoreductase involved in siderophore biosynthesis
MVTITRLETFVDLDGADNRHLSVSARLDAVLTDGGSLPLLTDRGWSSSGPATIWSTTSPEEIEATARTVVGPDEPPEGRSHADAEADHWAHLTEVLRRLGVTTTPSALRALPHTVVLSNRLRTRLG